MRKFVALLAFAVALSGIGHRTVAEEQLSDNATIIIQREKTFVYALKGAHISVNGGKKTKLKNGKTVQLSVAPGRNAFKVKGSRIPGSSTITFDSKSGETYELKVSPRKGTAWAGACCSSAVRAEPRDSAVINPAADRVPSRRPAKRETAARAPAEFAGSPAIVRAATPHQRPSDRGRRCRDMFRSMRGSCTTIMERLRQRLHGPVPLVGDAGSRGRHRMHLCAILHERHAGLLQRPRRLLRKLRRDAGILRPAAARVHGGGG